MKIFELLDELTEEIQHSAKSAFSKKRTIDFDLIMEIIEDIKNAIPEDINEAIWITDEKTRILTEAQEEADQILNNVDDKIRELVEDNDITQAAYQKARDITDAAQQNARDVREGVLEYADELLGKVEGDLENYIKLISENRGELSSSSKRPSKLK